MATTRLPENDVLIGLVLPWAQQQHPEKYEQTLKQATKPQTFRAYLLRLLEIRWTEDKGEWQRDVPMGLLEETTITARMRTRSGKVIVVAGSKVPNRDWSWAEIGMLNSQAEFETLLAVKTRLDLTVVEVENVPPSP